MVLLLAFVPRVRRAAALMTWRLRFACGGIGVLLALHWLTFYASIKHSNASVAATCIALTPVFLSFVEPLITRSRFDPRELMLGLLVIPGVALVVGGVPVTMRTGLLLGVLSAFFVSFVPAMNKLHIHRTDALAVTFIELGAGVMLLSVLAPLLPHDGPAFVLPDLHDAVLLLVLAVACTIVPFALSLVALRHLSAFASQLAVNLEPVYAVVFAAILLGERRELRPQFYGGVLVILVAVFAHPMLTRARRAEPST